MADIYTLTIYLPGKGPRFRLVAGPALWRLDYLPAEGGPPIPLAEGREYPSRLGAELPYDEPQTIGALLHFIIAAHPGSGSGSHDGDNGRAPSWWLNPAALYLAASHLDVLTHEADELEAGYINPDPEED